MARATRLAEDVLFPAALETDRSELVAAGLLDQLAAAGLYGLAGPPEAGGLGADPETFTTVAEVLASGCLTTTFVFMQHHGAVRTIAAFSPAELRREWLEPLCRGERRSGVAFAGLRRPGPPLLVARRTRSGWVLDGTAPWVTGWGRIDVVHVAARDDRGQVVWAMVDAAAGPSLEVEPLPLAAVAASGTVTVRFRDYALPYERVTLVEPFETWRARDAGGLRANGSLALGVARRCCALLGPSRYDAELRACREALDRAGVEELPAARARAARLALRAATLLVITSGGRAVLTSHHAQRLAREAVFLQVFGQTAAIRAEQVALEERTEP